MAHQPSIGNSPLIPFAAIVRDRIFPREALLFMRVVNGKDICGDEVVIIARRDFSVLLTFENEEAEFANIASVEERDARHTTLLRAFLRRLGEQKNALSDKFFVELDDKGAGRWNCLISTHHPSASPANGLTLSFRCTWNSTRKALRLLHSGEADARQMRNQAAMCGGIWDERAFARVTAVRSTLDFTTMDPRPNFVPGREVAGHPWITIARTAEFDYLQTRDFVERLSDYERTDGEELPFIAFITSIDGLNTTELLRPGMRIRPEHDIPLPADLLHATPEEIAELMARKLYEDLALDTENIIIMDSFTISRASVMVMNIRPDVITDDDLEFEMIADEASRQLAGLLRKDPMEIGLWDMGGEKKYMPDSEDENKGKLVIDLTDD